MVVLVVEDNPVSSRFVESVLHGAGYQVLVAQTRSEAMLCAQTSECSPAAGACGGVSRRGRCSWN